MEVMDMAKRAKAAKFEDKRELIMGFAILLLALGVAISALYKTTQITILLGVVALTVVLALFHTSSQARA